MTRPIPAAILLGGSALATIAWLVSWPAAARIPIALAFLFVCPGLALLRLAAPFADAENPLVLAVALSVAVSLIGTTVMTAVGWSSSVFFAVLVAISVAGAAADLLRIHNHRALGYRW